MPYGFNGKILRIDLTGGTIEVERPDVEFYRTYWGGRSLGLYFLCKETPPSLDPYDPQNLLIFASSPVTGTPFPGNARFSVVTKSPLTGGMGEAEAGGPFGPELKWAGWDAIIIRGAASTPVYITIKDDQVEIKPADHLWGKDTHETDMAVMKESGDPKARALTIGPAGENGVRYALISAGAHDALGRTGVGAVMGSKKLKAVVVRGTGKVQVADHKKLMDASRWFASTFQNDPTDHFLWQYGTMGGPKLYGDIGSLPTKNFKCGVMPDMDKILGRALSRGRLLPRQDLVLGLPGLLPQVYTCQGWCLSQSRQGSRAGIRDARQHRLELRRKQPGGSDPRGGIVRPAWSRLHFSWCGHRLGDGVCRAQGATSPG